MPKINHYLIISNINITFILVISYIKSNLKMLYKPKSINFTANILSSQANLQQHKQHCNE